MLEAANVIDLLGKTSGHNDKLYILKKNENVRGLKEILQFIYNPYIRTGISDSKLFKATGFELPKCAHTITYDEAIKYFSIHRTGSDADLVFARAFMKQATPLEVFLAKAIITQDLKIGITSTSLNKVFGKTFIPKMGCMLGTLFSEVGNAKTKWPCIVTEKFDGVRRVITKENGVCRAFSRSGHEDFGLTEILNEMQCLPDNTAYDGECLAKGTFKNSIEQRQMTNSITGSSGEKVGLTYNMFDMVPLDEFREGVSKDCSLNRKILLGATMMDESIQLLTDRWPELIPAFGCFGEFSCVRSAPILGVVNSLEDATPIVEKIWERGGEGIMLNTITGLYELKRVKTLLKVKNTEEFTLKIVGFNEGQGDREDSLGSFIVDYNGVKVGVGGRLSKTQRDYIWTHQEEFLGKFIELDSFGESTNTSGQKSLNCPIFKRFFGDEE